MITKIPMVVFSQRIIHKELTIMMPHQQNVPLWEEGYQKLKVQQRTNICKF